MRSAHTTVIVNIHSQHNMYYPSIESASSFYSQIVCTIIPHRKSMRLIEEHGKESINWQLETLLKTVPTDGFKNREIEKKNPIKNHILASLF